MISDVVMGTIAEAKPQSLSACPDTDVHPSLFVFLFSARFCLPEVNRRRAGEFMLAWLAGKQAVCSCIGPPSLIDALSLAVVDNLLMDGAAPSSVFDG
jgi:hypothetical protein